jgi:hypothetical protein
VLQNQRSNGRSCGQVLQARSHKTLWEKNREGGLEPLNKAADVLLSVTEKSVEVVSMLGECLQKAGRGDEVGTCCFLRLVRGEGEGGSSNY